jgi:hypothetical protein
MRRNRDAPGDRSDKRRSKQLARFAVRRTELDRKVREAQAEIEAKERAKRDEELRARSQATELNLAFRAAMDQEE